MPSFLQRALGFFFGSSPASQTSPAASPSQLPPPQVTPPPSPTSRKRTPRARASSMAYARAGQARPTPTLPPPALDLKFPGDFDMLELDEAVLDGPSELESTLLQSFELDPAWPEELEALNDSEGLVAGYLSPDDCFDELCLDDVATPLLTPSTPGPAGIGTTVRTDGPRSLERRAQLKALELLHSCGQPRSLLPTLAEELEQTRLHPQTVSAVELLLRSGIRPETFESICALRKVWACYPELGSVPDAPRQRSYKLNPLPQVGWSIAADIIRSMRWSGRDQHDLERLALDALERYNASPSLQAQYACFVFYLCDDHRTSRRGSGQPQRTWRPYDFGAPIDALDLLPQSHRRARRRSMELA